MSLPARKQTFAMENCRDVHRKLEWEIGALKACPGNGDLDPILYHAFNCAVTAWTLTDWVWSDMTLDQRKKRSGGLVGKASFRAFQSECRTQCRALHLCRQIATASKHGEVTAYPDPMVKVDVSAVPIFRNDAARMHMVPDTWHWTLTVHDGAVDVDALKMFEDALHFWDFIYREGIAA